MEILNVNAGDKVVRSSWTGGEICEVINVTPSGMIDIKYGRTIERYNKDGNFRGGNKWNRTHIFIPSKERIKELELEKEKREFVYFLSNYQYNNLPIETLRELVSIIEERINDGKNN